MQEGLKPTPYQGIYNQPGPEPLSVASKCPTAQKLQPVMLASTLCSTKPSPIAPTALLPACTATTRAVLQGLTTSQRDCSVLLPPRSSSCWLPSEPWAPAPPRCPNRDPIAPWLPALLLWASKAGALAAAGGWFSLKERSSSRRGVRMVLAPPLACIVGWGEKTNGYLALYGVHDHLSWRM